MHVYSRSISMAKNQDENDFAGYVKKVPASIAKKHTSLPIGVFLNQVPPLRPLSDTFDSTSAQWAKISGWE